MRILLFLVFLCVVLTKNPPTVLDFYMESLCPYCIKFTSKLKNLFSKAGNEELVTVNFYPYGNAEETETTEGFKFTCQHGEKECRGNLIETCAINVFDYPTANNFIVCLESKYSGDFDETSKECLNADQLETLHKCVDSEEGIELQHEIAQKTDSLQPPHKYVPWVVLDGVWDKNITDAYDLVAYLCAKRSDKNELEICKKSSTKEMTNLRFMEREMVCMRDS